MRKSLLAKLTMLNSRYRKNHISNIKFRNVESKEEVKQAISSLEKEALLLDLIQIAFNEDLETENQIASLLVETPRSIKSLVF